MATYAEWRPAFNGIDGSTGEPLFDETAEDIFRLACGRLWDPSHLEELQGCNVAEVPVVYVKFGSRVLGNVPRPCVEPCGFLLPQPPPRSQGSPGRGLKPQRSAACRAASC